MEKMNSSYDSQTIRTQGWIDQDRKEGEILSGEPQEGSSSPQGEAIKILSGITVIIYALIDPRNGAIRYIGKTTNRLTIRLSQHLSSLHKNVHKTAWIKSLLSQGLKPIIEEIHRIENSDDTDWQQWEKFWIVYLRFIGADLTNLDEGGVGGRRRSEETKAKIGMGNRGKKHSKESVEVRRLMLTGRKLSEEHKAKMSLAVKGTKLGPRPPEVIAKISAALTGKKAPRTKEHQAKITAALIGRKVSDETRAKIGAVQRGKKRGSYSEAHREAISASLKGRVIPQDQRDKMRVSALRRWSKSTSASPNQSPQTAP